MRVLVLFTRDLRIHDHPALTEACAVADDIVPTFVLDEGMLSRSSNRARFLTESLVDLDRNLRRIGGRLLLRRGDTTTETVGIARDFGCDTVFVTSDVTDFARARQSRLAAGLSTAGVGLRTFPGHSVIEPGDVAPGGGRAYRVFSPYLRAWTNARARPVLPAPAIVRVPANVSAVDVEPASIVVDSIDLPPGGESAGRRRLNAYVTNGVRGYAALRNDLAADETSRLSPYLRFGCVSSNETVRRAREAEGAEDFVRQICWRDFFRQLVADDPSLTRRDMRPRSVMEPPLDAVGALDAWRQGRTGLPLVDAGMRQLRREGWMHNRSRLVVGSFLTRRLGIPWQEGARHFLRWLVDGDPPNNAGGWQWVAGTGTDPRRSRAFNPVRQARAYDASGEYVRRYVRELSGAPDDLIFAPWRNPRLLQETGYPAPLISVPSG